MRLMNVNFCSQSQTTISASNIDSNFPSSNLKHQFRSKRVRTAIGTTTLAVVFDMATTEAIDSVVFLWPKEDGIRLSDTATIKIQANATNVWTSPAVDVSLTIDNTYVLASHFFTSDQTYRYWRVYIDDPSNPNDFIELGVVWLGKGLDLPSAQNGFKFKLVDQSKVTVNDFGHQYADEYPQLISIELGYQFLDYDDVQTLENAYRVNGNRIPVMFVIDPLEDVFNKNHHLIYGKMEDSLDETHVRYSLFNMTGILITEIL